MIVGHDKAVEQFAAAWQGRKLHHAWLLAGPKGVGKATFAHAAARRVLADAAGPSLELPGIATPDDHPVVRLVEAGSHPDMRWLQRLTSEKTGDLARNISVDQVRELGEFMGMTAALSPWRVAVIDSLDDLEKSAANALLKMLEEPPSNTLYLLISHAPGRLLPTIRSRCRLLHFDALGDDAMTSILTDRSAGLAARLRSLSWVWPSSRKRRWRFCARATRPMPAGPSWRASSARKHRASAMPPFSSSRRR